MANRALRLCLLVLTAATTSACASGHSVKATSARPGTLAGKGASAKPGPGGVVKIGNPYRIGDKWYYPADIPDYDETGIASWYGPQFHKQRTANGEIFDMNEISAAHPILPMPSYVEVTNLNNGRQLVVRINDRGPFAKDRIIDLSRRAAQLLGFDQTGTAPVRVRRVYPEGADAPLPQTTIARNQTPAGPQPAASQPRLQTAPQYASAGVAPGAVTQTPLPPAPAQPAASAAPATSGTGLVYIQVAALSDSQRAETLALNLRRFGASQVQPAPSGVYRVQIGPFESRQSAEIVLAEIRAAGYSDARVTLRPVS